MRTEYTLYEFLNERMASQKQRDKFTRVLKEEEEKRKWNGNAMTYEDLLSIWVSKMY